MLSWFLEQPALPHNLANVYEYAEMSAVELNQDVQPY